MPAIRAGMTTSEFLFSVGEHKIMNVTPVKICRFKETAPSFILPRAARGRKEVGVNKCKIMNHFREVRN
jgi:hypothetical protein